jgi:hypothetical protein
MENNFYDDWTHSKTKETKKTHEVNTVSLSGIINDGACIYCICIGEKCTAHHGRNAEDVPFLLKKIIKNPSKVLGPNILQDNNIPTHGKRIHTNSCVFILAHGTCKNCEEGRFKNVIYKNNDGEKVTLKFCFPNLKEDSNVVPIGWHADFILKYKGNEILDIKVLPYSKNNITNKHIQNESIQNESIQNESIKKTFWTNCKNKIFNDDDDDENINKSIKDDDNINKSMKDDDNIIKSIKDDDNIIKSIKDDENINKSMKDDEKINDNKYNTTLKNENKILKNVINGLRELENLNKQNENIEQIEQIEELKNIIKKIKNDNRQIEQSKIKYFNDNKLSLERIKELEKSQLTEQDIKKIEKYSKYFSNSLFDSFVKSYNDSDF